MSEKNKRTGFTLVEIIVVIIIIGILAGVTYLTFGSGSESVNAKACGGNRETIKMAYDTYLFDNDKKDTEYTLQNFIDGKYMGKVENEKASCPSGGTYSEGASAFHTVICSKHKEETFSYTYTDKSWADMEKDRSAFLLQLTKDLQSAYSKLEELFPNHADRLAALNEIASGTNINVKGESLRVMDEIAKLTAQLNLSSFISTSTGSLSDYKIGMSDGKISAIAIKAGNASGSDTNTVYVYYPESGHIYSCRNDINRDGRAYLRDESLAQGYTADSSAGWKQVQ